MAVTLRSIGDGVITVDTHGRVVMINLEAERMTGWEHEQAVGRPHRIRWKS
ncbi:MAG: PAS domain-containing protein [Deltaproteobacteria bacterium]|nr:PAS domain-containing protein [Deltaproteobacteria bacterium]